MRKFVSLCIVAVLAVFAVIALGGCSLLGGCDTQPELTLQPPFRFGVATRPAQLPPSGQTAVFAAPVAPLSAAPRASAICEPVIDVAPEPVFSARRRSTLEK